MDIEELKIKRNLSEAGEYCKFVNSNLSYYRDNGYKNKFEKTYIEEYYPFYLFFLYKYEHLDYSFSLSCDNSKHDGQIYDVNSNIHEQVQITCASIDPNSVLQHEMLLNQGFAPRIGRFAKKNGIIEVSGTARNKDGAIFEIADQIVSAILKKEAKKYKNIDVLLIFYAFAFNTAIENWNLLILEKIRELINIENITFSNIYLVEDNGTVDRLK